jgi:hypothetical protein
MLSSALSLVVLASAFALHFKWHPLRAHFSDSLDCLRTNRQPLWICLLAILLNQWSGQGIEVPEIRWIRGDFSTVNEDVMALIQAGFQEAVLLFHQALPPMPLSLLLPAWLVMLTVGVIRYPFRYGSQAVKKEERLLLMILSILSVIWTVVYFATRWLIRTEQLESGLSVAGFAFSALSLAGYQVWLACLVIEWVRPTSGISGDADTKTAVQEVFARWRNVLWLGGFNAVWIGFASWMRAHDPLWAWAFFYEMLLFFAPLPVAIASSRGDFLHVGGFALRGLWRCWLPLLGWVLTAVVVLCMARYALEVFRMQFEFGPYGAGVAVVSALLTSFLHTWLLVSAMLVLYRNGFQQQDRDLY